MSRDKLVSHRTTETTPSGTTFTLLHLTPEGRAGLTTNGATIQAIEDWLAEIQAEYPEPPPMARVVRRRWWWPW